MAYFLYAIMIIYVISSTKLIQFKTTVAQNGHLSWKFVPLSVTILLPWLLLFFIPFFLKRYYFTGVFTLIIIAVSIYTYLKDGTWGSMWCWFAAVASVYFILLAFCKAGTCAKLKLT